MAEVGENGMKGEGLAVALRGKVLEVSIGGNMEINAVNCSFCGW